MQNKILEVRNGRWASASVVNKVTYESEDHFNEDLLQHLHGNENTRYWRSQLRTIAAYLVQPGWFFDVLKSDLFPGQSAL